jgi:hypothetical protein
MASNGGSSGSLFGATAPGIIGGIQRDVKDINMDMVQLKLQQRMLKEQLQRTQGKMGRLSEILNKKKEKQTFKPDSGYYNGAKPEEYLMTTAGVPLADFKFTSYPRKLPPLPKKEIEPTPILDERMLMIRQTHTQRTVGKQIVYEKLKEKERKAKEYEARRAPKQFPRLRVPPSFLPNRYLRGELPCTIEHGANGKYLSWACPLENLDYDYYLPIFFDGLQCKQEPIQFLATQGIEDMLFAAKSNPMRVINCMKSLVRPLRNAMSKFDAHVLLNVLKAVQQLLLCGDGVGEALMPHTRQFLAPMAAFLDDQRNIGDHIDYGQRKRNDIGEEVRLTLELMEEKSGPEALKAIKFCIPCCKSNFIKDCEEYVMTLCFCLFIDQSCMTAPDAHHHMSK